MFTVQTTMLSLSTSDTRAPEDQSPLPIPSSAVSRYRISTISSLLLMQYDKETLGPESDGAFENLPAGVTGTVAFKRQK